MQYRKRYEEKVKQGEARNAAWRALTPAQQLAELDSRLGKGNGATRQRSKLAGGTK